MADYTKNELEHSSRHYLPIGGELVMTDGVAMNGKGIIIPFHYKKIPIAGAQQPHGYGEDKALSM